MKIHSLFPVLLLCAISSATAAENIRIEYSPVETTHENIALQSIQNSDVNPIFLSYLRSTFHFANHSH